MNVLNLSNGEVAQLREAYQNDSVEVSYLRDDVQSIMKSNKCSKDKAINIIIRILEGELKDELH